ncbi:MAG: hypothetical protein ACI91T_003213 [Natronomonas sp.]|jgi:hypothetical protein
MGDALLYVGLLAASGQFVRTGLAAVDPDHRPWPPDDLSAGFGLYWLLVMGMAASFFGEVAVAHDRAVPVLATPAGRRPRRRGRGTGGRRGCLASAASRSIDRRLVRGASVRRGAGARPAVRRRVRGVSIGGGAIRRPPATREDGAGTLTGRPRDREIQPRVWADSHRSTPMYSLLCVRGYHV